VIAERARAEAAKGEAKAEVRALESGGK
jgi:hypothetical protein